MHSTRVATFLLGAWIGCCVFMDLLALQNLRLVGRRSTPPGQWRDGYHPEKRPGADCNAAALFRRRTIPLLFLDLGADPDSRRLLLAAVLYLAAEKRWFPQILCGLMLALVLFQLAIHPELIFRGREADFPPGNQSLGTQARIWALTEVWIGAETAKLLIGGLLTAFMIGYKSRRRSRRVEVEDDVRTRSVERMREQF